ncbi:YebC/PmpR family DNA-binding transcriptional regulator [Pelagibacteraceae bacterium]|nr:YebC/PmpR family DNA-binding transcriptional regulator [Pelagibacteraceae bacterium]
MAGHSHWAGIKHKKGKQDKVRSKIFAKLSREVTVAAKLGAKDPASNPRLRAAIQASREANMPKENIARAISKSEIGINKNYENLRYEGFGPYNTALIIETLTDNKNRTASNIRTILQKSGGRLGETGSTAHYFFVCGVLHVIKDRISDEKILELSINAGAKDCTNNDEYHEILTEREDFYKIKSEIGKSVDSFLYSGIEWRPETYLDISKEESEAVVKMLEILEDDDDVQNTFVNCNIHES